MHNINVTEITSVFYWENEFFCFEVKITSVLRVCHLNECFFKYDIFRSK